MGRKQFVISWLIAILISTFSFAQEAGEYAGTLHSMRAEVGKEFSITLESNQTTGYQWQLEKPVDKSLLKLVGSQYQAPDTKLVGAAGKEVWIFKALKPGKTLISFIYLRPWEKNVPPAKKKVFIIIIK